MSQMDALKSERIAIEKKLPRPLIPNDQKKLVLSASVPILKASNTRAGRLFATSTRHYYQKIHRKASKAMVPTIKNDRLPIVHQENVTEGEENVTVIEETEVVEIAIAVVRADAAAVAGGDRNLYRTIFCPSQFLSLFIH